MAIHGTWNCNLMTAPTVCHFSAGKSVKWGRRSECRQAGRVKGEREELNQNKLIYWKIQILFALDADYAPQKNNSNGNKTARCMVRSPDKTITSLEPGNRRWWSRRRNMPHCNLLHLFLYSWARATNLHCWFHLSRCPIGHWTFFNFSQQGGG